MKTDEAMLLAQILIDQSFFHELAVDASCFLREDTRRIYNAIAACVTKGVKPDLISVRDSDPMIDANELVKITDLTHSAANWKYYEGKVLTAYKRKSLVDLGKMLCERGIDGELDAIISATESTLMRLTLDNAKERVQRLDELAPGYVKELQDRWESKDPLRGIPSGFDSIDKLTHGFQARRLYYIGARPSQGKSAIMLNMASHVGIKCGIACGIISIESSGNEIIERLFASVGNMPADMLAEGNWHKSMFTDIIEMGARIKGRPFYIYDKPNLRIDQLKSVARVMKNVYGAKIIFVDYLQLIRNCNARLSKVDVVMESSQALKELARELEIPIVCLAQLGRDADEKRPDMGSFQWSSQAEQDGDAAFLIWHEQVDENTNTWLLCVKNRDGKRGDLPFSFNGDFLRFTEKDTNEN
jgi:replicative DNA helicase